MPGTESSACRVRRSSSRALGRCGSGRGSRDRCGGGRRGRNQRGGRFLATVVNGVAAVVFIAATDVDWAAAGVIAAGSTLGGWLGAKVGRRLPPAVLRGVIVLVGGTAAVAVAL
ncbi:TSUP family transporter [Streptomyces sp. NPDC048639]|uniref:TSUP family transporter n=1 Tax=Streptomyces sp. NPDC048639 TaxID=3365581 RepID=UPI00371818AC